MQSRTPYVAANYQNIQAYSKYLWLLLIIYLYDNNLNEPYSTKTCKINIFNLKKLRHWLLIAKYAATVSNDFIGQIYTNYYTCGISRNIQFARVRVSWQFLV